MNKKLLTFGYGDDNYSFIVEEIACISYSAYNIIVKILVASLAVLLTLFALKINIIIAIIAGIIGFKMVSTVFKNTGNIVTTGGKYNISYNWDQFKSIIKKYQLLSDNDDIVIEESTRTKDNLHLINPKRMSSFKKKDGDIQSIFFGFAIILFISLFWTSKFAQIIIPLIVMLIGIGVYIWEVGIETNMVGGHTAFFVMSKRKAEEVLTQIHAKLTGTQDKAKQTFSSSIMKEDISTIIGILAIILAQKSGIEKGSKEGEKEEAVILSLLFTTTGKDEEATKKAYNSAAEYINNSENTFKKDFRDGLTYLKKLFDVNEMNELYENTIDVLYSIAEIGGVSKQQKPLVNLLKNK